MAHETRSTSSEANGLSTYPAGHSAAVLRSHASRNAQNSAAHLVPHLKPGQRVLDVGCGPGTITLSIAELVGPNGSVVGIDPSDSVIQQAQALANERSVENVSFQVGDGLSEHGFPFPNGHFDVVHAHQVLQHVSEPTRLLREMMRLAKPSGGIISLRECDFSTMFWHPDSSSEGNLLNERWMEIYLKVTRAAGAQPEAGRRLPEWCRKAGIRPEEITCVSAGTMSYGQTRSPASSASATQGHDAVAEAGREREWWGALWADRTAGPDSGFAKSAVETGVATQEELDSIAQTLREWSQHPDGWFVMMNGEVIVRLKGR